MSSQSVLARARSLVARHILQPCEQWERKLAEAKIDAAFSKMADDPDYLRDSITTAHQFETSDWEATRAVGSTG
jgi:hypothetical protein